MHRNADGAFVIKNMANDALLDPPARIRTERVTLIHFKFIYGPHQTDVTRLHQIHDRLVGAVSLFDTFCIFYDKAEVMFHDNVVRRFVSRFNSFKKRFRFFLREKVIPSDFSQILLQGIRIRRFR